MKRVEVTVPADQQDAVAEEIEAFTDDAATSEVEKDDRAFRQFEFALESGDIDELTENLKGITDLETGDLTIEVLEETARIEKGKRREGGDSSLSIQEMYAKAFEYAASGRATWALIALGAGIAVFGAATENVMVVIGSMVITPMLGPFIAASFGLVIGDQQLIQDSIYYGLFSIALAILAGFIIALAIPVQSNPLIELIAHPGFATIPLSLFVGAAAALTFTTEMRESLAGVAVAIALVPPAAVVGIALSLADIALLVDVLLVLVTNVISLILAGSLTFKAFGITPSTYHRQQVSEAQLRKALIISIASITVIGGAVAFISYNDLQNTYLESDVEQLVEAQFSDRVLDSEVVVTGNRVSVDLAVVNPRMDADAFEAQIREITDREVTVKLLAIQGAVSDE